MWCGEEQFLQLVVYRKPSGLYSSAYARDTSHWAKKTWDALFLVASDFPHKEEGKYEDELTVTQVEKKRVAFEKMLINLAEVLPCHICAEHFKKYINKNDRKPLKRAMENRENLFKWLYKAKDEVNKRLGKKSIEYKKVRDKYIP
jgi:hypothetical protein